jgi:hypothetical protein
VNLETVSKKILEMRRRLEAITEELAALPDDARGAKANLRDEERQLTVRLADLQDSFSRPAGEAFHDIAAEPLAPRQTSL